MPKGDSKAGAAVAADPEDWESAKSVYEFTVKDMDGQDVSLEKYRGNLLIIINVASKCGYTKKNYDQMNSLFGEYECQGLRIAGFPCSQFRNQEYDDICKVKAFIEKKDVEWDVYSHVKVNGADADPLFKYLKASHGTEYGTKGLAVGSPVKWNFVKFLIDRNGQPIGRYSSATTNSLEAGCEGTADTGITVTTTTVSLTNAPLLSSQSPLSAFLFWSRD